MEDIPHIYKSELLHQEKPDFNPHGKKKQKKRKPSAAVKKHFKNLTAMVDEAHKELEENHSPFRLCVYQEGEDIYIDVVTIDESGKTDQVFKHNITNEELQTLMQQIKSGRGLILDANA
ncbi:MAG: hypothetical protein GY729_10740 [Desulfobacteraceae bacterium]|nr:hypothetical protein [Desulfobacteraceae bacterium]